MEGEMMKKYANLAGLVGFVAALAGFVVYSVNSRMTTLAVILLSIGAILLIGNVALRFQEIKSGMTSRSAKFGSNAFIMVVFIFGILVVANMLLSRFTYRLDTTASKMYSLSDQTKKVLKNLDKDVKVFGFFKLGEEGRAQEFMTEYAHFSTRFKSEFIDPDKKPGMAKKYGVSSYGTIVLECQDKQEKFQDVTEEAITNALIKATREGVKRIYFTTGHGEKDYDNSEQTGYSSAKEAIAELNYEIEKIFLVQPPDSIPADCALLIISGPLTDLLQPERAKIDSYLERGGKLLLMLEPESPQSYSDLLAEWGIDVGNDLIVELSAIGQLFGAGPVMPVVNSYESHAISEGFSGMMSLFSQVRSVAKNENSPAGVTVTEIARTSANSWGETSPLDAEGRVGFDQATDNQGPLSVFTVAEKNAENPIKGEDAYDLGSGDVKTRLAIFGDSDFASNAYFKFQANGNLFLNTVNWLAMEEDLISIRPRDPEDRRLSLTAKQSKMMLWFGVILLPLFVFALGIFVYRKRK
jgi:ABC-type uncharacterized transport system involved in gliding motility auxiliary subunit